MAGYNPAEIEKKWQQFWDKHQTFATPLDTSKSKFYVLDMFPYPSGQGLHVGHPEGYTASDIVARYKRGNGVNVLHPMGWDAFGLPAEQYAIKNGVHPRDTTAKNIVRFREQLKAIGFSYDWGREVDTTDPEYYRWTQRIFLLLFDTWFDEEQQRGRPISELIAKLERENAECGTRNAEKKPWRELSESERRDVLSGYRLAYIHEAPVNWCQALGTVLANEEVIDGKSEVGGFPVERRPMKQWMLRITAYAQRLIDGLEKLEWSDSLKEMQRNWIGRSEGAAVHFKIDTIVTDRAEMDLDTPLTVFTTRPDTLFGATYMVIAPEHELARGAALGGSTLKWPAGVPSEWTGGKSNPGEAVTAYRQWASSRSDRERQEDTSKTGVFTGFYAINPLNGERIPIFTSDYVLMTYGTGAIMAVPAHDERDHEFARKFKLPIKQVVAAADGKAVDVLAEAFTHTGIAVNSPLIDGLPTAAAKAKMIDLLEAQKIGKRQIQFKIRDWLFSRQRYWGEPFPLVHLEDGTVVPLAPEQLPLTLPALEDFKPTGTIDPPLSKAPAWFNVHVTLDASGAATVVPAGTPGAVPAKRELNTMPQWAGSCWYYLRYTDPKNANAFVDPAREAYWMGGKSPDGKTIGTPGVDLYIGGVEHAVLHLLYARFWHKVLFDRGLVSTDEPFRKLVNQGLILGEAEYTVFREEGSGVMVSYEFVDPEIDTRATPAGTIETISKDKRNGNLLIGERHPAADVEKRGDHFVLRQFPEIRVDARSFKMSKSRGNVVNPDDVITEYGADSLRLFEMFMGPLEQVKPWSTAGVEGVYRFLQRVWRNLIESDAEQTERPVDAIKTISDPAKLPADQQAIFATDAESIKRPLHRMIKKVSDDIERLSFNTAISTMMEFNNALAKLTYIPNDVALTFIRVLEPFAPHIAEELYARLGGESAKGKSVSQTPWPMVDAALLVDTTLDLPVQINGKVRGRVLVPADANDDAVFALTFAEPELQKHLAGKDVKKKIYVKGRMINLVV